MGTKQFFQSGWMKPVKFPLETDVAIVGAGITGVSIARELSRYKIDTTVLEKSPDIFTGQTKTSHAVVYNARSLVESVTQVVMRKSGGSSSGMSWNPKSMKMKLIMEGYDLFEPLVNRLEVNWKCAKNLVIARDEEELNILNELYEMCKVMGIENDVRSLSRNDILDMEPNITKNVLGGLYEDKWSKLVFAPEYAIANKENAFANGVRFLYGAGVTGIKPDAGGFVVETPRGSVRSKFVVNAAGLYADKIAEMAGAVDDWQLVHFRTQQMVMDKRLEPMFESANVVLSPPRPGAFDQVISGVHGNPYIACGQYDPTTDKEGNETKKEWFGVSLERARGLMPFLSKHDLITSFVGVRAFNTRDFSDNILEFSKQRPRFFNALIRLPGICISPAMAKYVVSLLGNEGLSLAEKSDYNPCRKRIPQFSRLSDDRKRELIRENPKYGNIVCRCETVSEGEIVEAIRRGARTIQGIQFATRAGMGRCQRNWCGPRLMDILAKELGIERSKVTFKGPGSEILRSGIGR